MSIYARCNDQALNRFIELGVGTAVIACSRLETLVGLGKDHAVAVSCPAATPCRVKIKHHVRGRNCSAARTLLKKAGLWPGTC